MVRRLASSHEGAVFLPNKPPASWDPFGERIWKGTSTPFPGALNSLLSHLPTLCMTLRCFPRVTNKPSRLSNASPPSPMVTPGCGTHPPGHPALPADIPGFQPALQW